MSNLQDKTFRLLFQAVCLLVKEKLNKQEVEKAQQSKSEKVKIKLFQCLHSFEVFTSCQYWCSTKFKLFYVRSKFIIGENYMCTCFCRFQNGHTIPIEKVDVGFETGGMYNLIFQIMVLLEERLTYYGYETQMTENQVKELKEIDTITTLSILVCWVFFLTGRL